MTTLQCQYCGSTFDVPSPLAKRAGSLHFMARHRGLIKSEKQWIRLVLA